MVYFRKFTNLISITNAQFTNFNLHFSTDGIKFPTDHHCSKTLI